MKEKEKLLRYANLPQKIQKTLMNEKQLIKLEESRTQQQIDIIKQILTYLNIYSITFDSPQKNFNFNLPPCYFDLDSQDEILQIDVPVFDEKIPRQNLTEKMLEQIKKDGSFKVESKKFEMDYQWKISTFLIKGTEVVLKQFRRILGFAHQLLIRTQRLFSFGKAIYVMSEGRKYPINLWSALAQIPAFFLNLFALIFGVPMYSIYYGNTKTKINDQILKDRTCEIDEKKFPNIMYLVNNTQKLQVKNNNKSEISQHNKKVHQNLIYIEQMHKDMQNLWNDYYYEQKEQLEDCEQKEYDMKINIINSQKQKFIIGNFDNIKTKMEEKLRQCLKDYLIVVNLIHKLQNEKLKRQSKLQSQTIEAIKKENPYLYNVFFWFKHQKKVQFKRLEKQVQEEFEIKFIKELEKQNLTEYKNLYKFTKQYFKTQKQNKEYKIKIVKAFQEPTQLNIMEQIYPPYKVIKYSENSYGFVKYDKTIIKTDHYFWRLTYFFKQWFIYSKNVVLSVYRKLVYGQFGIYGLIGKQEYYYDYSINYKTGEVKNNINKIVPIYNKFQNTLEGIRKSRKNFEDNPDNAIFGKDIQRIFNYIECYFFRLFIVGILYVLILHTLFNIVFIIMCIFTGALSFVYVYIFLVIQKIFNIVLYDYTQARVTYNLKLDYRKHFYEILIQNFGYFPIIHLVFNLLILGFFQIGHILFLAYFYPFISLLTGIWATSFFYLRSLYDNITFKFIIKPKAMVPSRDTNLARKIAGPGVSKNLFYTLKIEDSIQLVMAQLEKLKLQHYQKLIDEYLNEDQKELNKKLQEIISPQFGTIYLNQQQKIQIINKYISILQKEINKRNRQLDFLNKNVSFCKIKFTEDDLQELKESTIEILQNNLNEYLIDDFIWTYYDVKKGHFKRLTCKLIESVFNGNRMIMESLEESEQRIVMRDTKQSNELLSRKKRMINSVIKGDVLLKNYRHRFTHNSQQQQDLYTGCIDIQQLKQYLQNPQNENKMIHINLQHYVDHKKK